MTTKQKIQTISKLIQHYEELNQSFSQIYSLFGQSDSKFCDSVWNAFDAYTNTVSELVGDKLEWLPWFIFDNKCGAGKMSCVVNGKKKKVRSVADLVKIIEETGE